MTLSNRMKKRENPVFSRQPVEKQLENFCDKKLHKTALPLVREERSTFSF